MARLGVFTRPSDGHGVVNGSSIMYCVNFILQAYYLADGTLIEVTGSGVGPWQAVSGLVDRGAVWHGGTVAVTVLMSESAQYDVGGQI